MELRQVSCQICSRRILHEYRYLTFDWHLTFLKRLLDIPVNAIFFLHLATWTCSGITGKLACCREMRVDAKGSGVR